MFELINVNSTESYNVFKCICSVYLKCLFIYPLLIHLPKNKVLELLLLDHLYSEKYDNTNEIEKFV